MNHHVEGKEPDFVFPDHRLVVEADSWRFHRSREAFERDRRRDAVLTAAGYRTPRFTHRQLADEPRDVVRILAAALASSDVARAH